MELLSDTMMMVTTTEMVSCLNPCSNGILSDKKDGCVNIKVVRLNPCSNGILSDLLKYLKMNMVVRLNPCSNGILSDNSEHQEG